jgi:hypothetical protein
MRGVKRPFNANKLKPALQNIQFKKRYSGWPEKIYLKNFLATQNTQKKMKERNKIHLVASDVQTSETKYQACHFYYNLLFECLYFVCE